MGPQVCLSSTRAAPQTCSISVLFVSRRPRLRTRTRSSLNSIGVRLMSALSRHAVAEEGVFRRAGSRAGHDRRHDRNDDRGAKPDAR
jgi:hypothetical protein